MSDSKHKIAGAGFEPATSGLWARRATRLLYPAIKKLKVQNLKPLLSRFTFTWNNRYNTTKKNSFKT